MIEIAYELKKSIANSKNRLCNALQKFNQEFLAHAVTSQYEFN